MEFLIKAIDAKMPTVEVWRKQLNELTIPQAQAFMQKWPHAEIAIEHKKKAEKYQNALETLKAADKEKHLPVKKVKPEDQTKAVLAVSEYMAAPLTKAEIDRVNFYHRATNPSTQEPLKAGEKVQHEGYPLVTHHAYYKHQVEVEALRTDEDKAQELADKDKRGCYKAGDVVAMRPDGFEWGRMECPPTFVVVKVPEITDAAEYEHLMKSPMEVKVRKGPNGQDEEHKVATQRRGHRVAIDGLLHGDTLSKAAFAALITAKS